MTIIGCQHLGILNKYDHKTSAKHRNQLQPLQVLSAFISHANRLCECERGYNKTHAVGLSVRRSVQIRDAKKTGSTHLLYARTSVCSDNGILCKYC